MATKTLTVTDPFTPVDLLLFREFKKQVPGLVEQTLAANPGLAALGPFPPVGTKVTVTIPTVDTTAPKKRVTLWTNGSS